MTGKTHQIIGIGCGLAYYLSIANPVYSPATLAAVVVGSHLGALLPDFDQAGSDIWDSIPFGTIAGKITDPFIKHRNISHSIMGTVIVYLLVGLLLSYFPNYWGIDGRITQAATMIAYISHLVADMVTVEGIPLIFPYKRMFGIPPKPLDGLRIVTGKWFENLVIFPLVNIALIAIIWSNWDIIKSVVFR